MELRKLEKRLMTTIAIILVAYCVIVSLLNYFLNSTPLIAILHSTILAIIFFFLFDDYYKKKEIIETQEIIKTWGLSTHQLVEVDMKVPKSQFHMKFFRSDRYHFYAVLAKDGCRVTIWALTTGQNTRLGTFAVWKLPDRYKKID